LIFQDETPGWHFASDNAVCYAVEEARAVQYLLRRGIEKVSRFWKYEISARPITCAATAVTLDAVPKIQ